MNESLIQILELVLSAIFGTGGLCAFIITLVKLTKRSKTYEVRCKLAAEFIKEDVVKVQPESAKKLMVDILEGKIDSKKSLTQVIRKEKTKIKKGK